MKKFIFSYSKKFKLARNILIFFAIFAVILFQFCSRISVVYADEVEEKSLEQQLEESIKGQLDKLNFSNIDDVLSSLNSNELEIFGANSFKGKIESVINGTFATGQKSIFTAIVNLVFDDILKYVPLLASIIIISIICGFVSNIKSENNGKSIGDIIHFVCYGVIIILTMTGVTRLITSTSNAIQLIKTQMEVVFPILLTLMTAIGGTASVAVYQPAVAFLSSFIMQIFASILMPLFIFMIVLL